MINALAKPKFGCVHVALYFRGRIIEWTEEELVGVFRFMDESSGLKTCGFAGDVKNPKDADIDLLTDKLVEFIIQCNAKSKYTLEPNIIVNNKEKYLNCQTFLCKAIEVMGTLWSPSGAVKSFFDEVKLKGKYTLKVFFGGDFRKKFGFKKKSMKFSRHDDKCTIPGKMCIAVGCRVRSHIISGERFSIPNDIEDMMEAFPDELALAKAIDRSFWLRFYLSNKPKDSPRKHEGRTECPFEDPIATYTCK